MNIVIRMILIIILWSIDKLGNYRIAGVFYQNTMVFMWNWQKKLNLSNTNTHFKAHNLRNCGQIHKIAFGSLKKNIWPIRFDIEESVSLMCS